MTSEKEAADAKLWEKIRVYERIGEIRNELNQLLAGLASNERPAPLAPSLAAEVGQVLLDEDYLDKSSQELGEIVCRHFDVRRKTK